MEQRKVELNLPFAFMLGAAFLFSACAGHQGSSFLPNAGTEGLSAGPGHPRPNATGTTSLTGPIVALITGGFTITVSSGCGDDHGHLHIYTNSSTAVSGGSPAVGRYASITGTGSCHISLTATSVTVSTTPPSPIPSSSPGATPTPGTTPTPNSSAAPYTSPTPYASPTPYTSGSPIPSQPNTTSVVSTINGVSSDEFTLNPANGVGYMPVHTNGSTVIIGGKPAVGLYAQVTGTGPLNDFTATSVLLRSTAPASITLSGTALGGPSYGFNLNPSATSSSGYSSVPIVMNSTTVVGGGTLATGAAVKVVGTGSQKTGIVAQEVVVSQRTLAHPTPTPGPISQTHLLSADYLGAPYGTTSIAWSAAAPYLTWAQVNPPNATAVSSVGIKTQYYIDPNQSAANDGDPMYTSNESTFAHDCSGNRVTMTNSGLTMYQMAIGASSLQTLFASIINSARSQGHYDAVWEDGAGTLEGLGISTMPCSYTDSQWLLYGDSLEDVSPLPVMINGIEMNTSQGYVSPALALLSATNTIGGNYEDCYSYTTMPKENGWLWADVENSELQVAAENKLFECQLRNLNSASSSADARIYALASFLLTYNPATSILWEEFATTSGLHVEPEEQLVVLDPLVAAPTSVSALQQVGGAYGRQYAQCYYAGKFVGSCAVAVNPNGSAATFPFPQYTHTLVLSGGGVIDGGTVSTSGPAPPISLPGYEAVIAFP